MNPAAPRCALVLAGGRSIRMGQPKATLPWGRRTMLEHVAERLSDCCDAVVVVGHAGQLLPSLGPRCTRVDDPLALDDQGPLAGAHGGLTRLAHDHPSTALVYLAAVDKPLLTRAHVEFVFAQLGNTDIDAVLPVQPGTQGSVLQPLAGAVRLGPALATAGMLLGQGERALKRLFTALPHSQLPADTLPSQDALRDCNTPLQYAAARDLASPDSA